jgi:hypothetical protein
VALNNGHPHNNVPPSVKSKVGLSLHRQAGHPLCRIKSSIHNYFSSPLAAGGHGPPAFKLFDDISPIVTTRQNFDELLTPADHVSRRPSDTFYVSDSQLLRCHTSAHQTQVPPTVLAHIPRLRMPEGRGGEGGGERSGACVPPALACVVLGAVRPSPGREQPVLVGVPNSVSLVLSPSTPHPLPGLW